MPAEARVKISAKSREYLRRLSIVYAYELRLTAVTELYLREMSPSQFYREFGGGSATRVERHFKRLTEYGWLRFVREASGERRRGGREHFYRATELAILDEEISALLPYSVRAAHGWKSFRQLAERARGALEAGTFDARPDRHLSSTSLRVDLLGRGRVIAAVDGLFYYLLKEQGEARLRVFKSGEKPFLATVGIAGFDSASGLVCHESGPILPEGAACLVPTYSRLSKVFGDEVCLSIVDELNPLEMSVSQYHREIGGASKSAIRYRFEMLEQIALLRRVGKMPRDGRRGPREHLYRAAGPMLSVGDVWSGLPDLVRVTDSWREFERIADQIKEAIMAGTFDANPDRHLTWSLLSLDRRGWENVIAAIKAVLAFIAEEVRLAKIRLAESGETPTEVIIAMMAFESPRGSERKP